MNEEQRERLQVVLECISKIDDLIEEVTYEGMIVLRKIPDDSPLYETLEDALDDINDAQLDIQLAKCKIEERIGDE